MNSFLITFKPSTENPERGWPIEELQHVVRRHQRGERVVEPWRFANQKDVSVGDRVFALRQGKAGPAIFGYGSVAGAPTRRGGTPVEFDLIVDPDSEVLVTREELSAIPGGSKYWRTQSSGILFHHLLPPRSKILCYADPSQRSLMTEARIQTGSRTN
jgi:hypothetical protein